MGHRGRSNQHRSAIGALGSTPGRGPDCREAAGFVVSGRRCSPAVVHGPGQAQVYSARPCTLWPRPSMSEMDLPQTQPPDEGAVQGAEAAARVAAQVGKDCSLSADGSVAGATSREELRDPRRRRHASIDLFCRGRWSCRSPTTADLDATGSRGRDCGQAPDDRRREPAGGCQGFVSASCHAQVREGLPGRVYTVGLRGAKGSKHGQVLRENGVRTRLIEPADEGTAQTTEAPAMDSTEVGLAAFSADGGRGAYL
jgi:hypothetical protein